MKEDIVIEHLMEIKERLAAIETKVEANADLESRIVAVEQEQTKTEASNKTLRRVLYFIVITVPVSVAALMKAFK